MDIYLPWKKFANVALGKYFTLLETNLSLFRCKDLFRDPAPMLEETYRYHYPYSIFSDHIFSNWDGVLHGQTKA